MTTKNVAELFEVPNLDDMSVAPSDYSAAAEVLRELAQYCEEKRMAMEARAAGNIGGRLNGAMAREAELERIYARLPDWARW